MKLHEPKSLIDVRKWKSKVSREIDRLGFKEFGRRASERFAAFNKEIETKRQAKLGAK